MIGGVAPSFAKPHLRLSWTRETICEVSNPAVMDEGDYLQSPTPAVILEGAEYPRPKDLSGST